MKTGTLARQEQQASAMVACLIMMLVVITAVSSLAAYVTQTVRLTHRRADRVAALQFGQGGAAIVARDLNNALTNRAGTFFVNLASGATAYTLTAEGTAPEVVYQRIMTAPFSNQTVVAQVWFPNSTAPRVAAIRCHATVGNVTQTNILHVKFAFGYGAAIISDNPGTTDTGVSKSTAQNGNVVVNGDRSGPIVVDGGEGLAIWANGNANVDPVYARVPADAILENAFGTTSQIPDYTVPGSADQLFNFSRFIAVADATPVKNSINPNRNNHFTNLTTFLAACNKVMTPGFDGALEGVVVVDIKKTDPSITPALVPNGINVRGTLIFNFGPTYTASDKIINTATMNINKADLSGLVATDPSTYTTGYPPVYTDPAKDPANVDITAKGFPNFAPTDDRPALMYNTGILDIHGNANICGVVYSPSFMEIENKQAGQIQYFRGSLIGGGGIYFENGQAATSVCSYDPATLDMLATSSSKGKLLVATYWE